MSQYETLSVRVRRVTFEAIGILSFELVPIAPLSELPSFTAGAHIELQLPQGLRRSYSLLNDPQERQRYVIAVNRDANSRGGSRHLHEVLRVGEVLEISAPRNHFAFDEQAAHSVFIAGGIGITPMLAMIARANALGKPWTLYCAARSQAHAAFVPELRQLAQAGRGRCHFHFDDEAQGRLLDLAQAVRDAPAAAHFYGCGPEPMLQAYEKATAALDAACVHLEYFTATLDTPSAGGFQVKLARSGQVVQVETGQSILDSLLKLGIEPPYSCKAGVCGTCEVAVLEGIPEHRDVVLSAAEKAANRRMMLCCSGAKTPMLTIDL